VSGAQYTVNFAQRSAQAPSDYQLLRDAAMSKHTTCSLNAPVMRTDSANSVPPLLPTLVAWQQRYELRRHLMAMDHWLLEDIGLSRAQAREEAAKPLWKA
jgi:uncharacterized protein YjiS (DUF1127 family)